MKKTLTFNEINELATKLANYVKPGDTISLIGDLGTGKTTFVKTFAKEFGIKGIVKSPTFNYVLEHRDGKFPLYHFDVYRISEPLEIYDVGYEDYIDGDGVVLIEWANLIESELPKEYIEINLEHFSEDSRLISINYIGDNNKEKELLDYVNFSNWYSY